MSVDELKNSWSAIADIGGKDVVFREAIATGVLQLSSSGIEAVKGRSKKGDVREISTIASIQAVKETPDEAVISNYKNIDDASLSNDTDDWWRYLHPGYRHLDDFRNYPNSNKVLDKVFFIGASPHYDDVIFNYIRRASMI